MKQVQDPAFERIDCDHTLSPADRPPLFNAHGMAAAAETLTISTLQRNDGAILPCLALYLGKVGLHHPMTPEGARMLANKLNLAADSAEADAAQAARAQLAATLKKGSADE